MNFSDSKYKALVGGNPQGLMLRDSIISNWNGWVCTFSDSRWSQKWKRPPEDAALTIFAESMWGFGMQNWLNTCGPMDLMKHFDKLRGSRVTMFDNRVYSSCRLMLPPEVLCLDKWLEPLWIRSGGYL